MKIVIIGGVAGGMSAATRLRRLSETAQITVLERSGHVSFANCGLPYYVGEVITDREALLLQTPQSLADRFNLDVRVLHEAVSIDRAAQMVRARDLTTGEEIDLEYDKLILSPGASPIRPPIPGIERALTLRNIEDTDEMYAAVGSAKSAIVIGGGFIGLEVAENLKFRGLSVTLIEAVDQVMAPLDPEMIAPVHASMREHGLEVLLGSQVTEITDEGVMLADGGAHHADIVISAVGVKPEVGLAQDAELDLGPLGGIAVGEDLRTSDENIFALGDAAEKTDFLTREPLLLPLAGPANRQGRRVADVIMGHNSAAVGGAGDRPVFGASILKLFDLDVAAVGWNEKRLRAAGREYRAIHTHPASHAGYYPGAAGLSLKVLYDPVSHELLGAQVVGAKNADKRIDVLATALQAGMKVTELADLELAYAPPFNSAKDPVNMIGYIAEAQVEGTGHSIQWHELEGAVASGAVIVDVRSAGEVEDGIIPGSVHAELDQLRQLLENAEPGDPILGNDLIVHCAVGLRGYFAARILAQAAAERGEEVLVRNLDGGMRTWEHGKASAGY